MMIPGSQARMWIGRPINPAGYILQLSQMVVFRFRTINVRPRAPRIDVTNSEGLPGGVLGRSWITAPGTANVGPTLNPFTPPGGAALSFPGFKDYPYESQLPGVGVCDLEVEQASWDRDQIVYSVPLVYPVAAAGALANFVPILPQRYVSIVIAPDYARFSTPELWVFPSIYIEEAPHRINVKQDQPVSFTGYSNGPWRYPRSIIANEPMPLPIS